MNLYESKIEFKAEQMLGSMIELSGVRSSQSKTPYTDLDQYLTVFSFGRQAGHTTAVCNWIKNNLSGTDLTVLVAHNRCAFDYIRRNHGSLFGDCNLLIVNASSYHQENIRNVLCGRRQDFDKVTILGDSVYLSDFRKVCNEVINNLLPQHRNSLIRATCVNPIV